MIARNAQGRTDFIALINTPLQRGVGRYTRRTTALAVSPRWRWLEAAKAAGSLSGRSITPLKRGVNERLSARCAGSPGALRRSNPSTVQHFNGSGASALSINKQPLRFVHSLIIL